MKILQVNAVHYRRGGAETVYFNTISLLKSKGHDVICFSSKDERNESECDNDLFVPHINIRKLSVFKKIQKVPGYLFNFSAARNLEKLILKEKPDIAHVHLFYNVLSVSVLKVLKKYNIPVVHSVHDYRLLCPVYTLFDTNGEICELCKDRRFYHCLVKKCSEENFFQSAMVMLEAYFWKYFMSPLKYIDHFIFVSSFIRDKHLEFSNKYKNRFSHLYNFISLNKSYTAPVRGNYFLYFGRLSREKGIQTLLRVFSKRDDLRLVIAGTGVLAEEISNVSANGKNISYVGFKTGKDLEKLILESSFIIVPSEWYENNPMTVIEAFNFGKPVIGAKIGGIPELVQNSVNGYTFNSGDIQSLEEAVDLASGLSDEEYGSFSEAAYLFAKNNFNSETHYKKLTGIYSDIINKKPVEE